MPTFVQVPDDQLPPGSPTARGTQASSQWAGGGCTVPWYLFETPALFNDPPMSDSAWMRHHSWLRHLPEPSTFSLLFYGLWPPVLWATLVTVFAGCYAEFLQVKPGWPKAVSKDYIEAFILTSFAVSLLLVFRANASYDRWWEARKAFGNMFNVVRNLSRMARAWLDRTGEGHIANEVCRWASVLTAAACTFLRDDPDFLIEEAGEVLTGEDLKWLLAQQQQPVAAMQVISALISRSSLTPFERAELERHLSSFDVFVGACERIRRQCVPLAYTRQTSRFLIIWLTFVPFALWAFLHWLTIPVVAVMSLLLIGIENISIQLEQPMMVLPLRCFSTGCRNAAFWLGEAQPGAVHVAERCLGRRTTAR
jgi:putative membrane protein